MPENGPGMRHTAIATKQCVHGQVVTEDKFVGTAFKVTQPDRFTRPVDYPTILVGEEFEIQVGGTCRVPLVAPYAAAVVGSRLWIAPATNVIDDAVSTGALPVGVIGEIDTLPTPDTALVNTNAWQAFLPGA